MYDATLSEIAQQHLNLATLMDGPDRHEVSADSVKAALNAAYLAGYAAAMRAAAGRGKPLPTEPHTMLGNEWVGQGYADELLDDPNAITVVTLAIPEALLVEDRSKAKRAIEVLVPTAIRHRRIR
ncbi:DUF6900 domain-containing protein [Lysobacter firmicutimachus]|uniref:DUF6900 domain-containing protein n=1 Tax=Lysobacter firmicutimachus TaxID=1792846 RepID=A0ABU8CWV9_9GAMM